MERPSGFENSLGASGPLDCGIEEHISITKIAVQDLHHESYGGPSQSDKADDVYQKRAARDKRRKQLSIESLLAIVSGELQKTEHNRSSVVGSGLVSNAVASPKNSNKSRDRAYDSLFYESYDGNASNQSPDVKRAAQLRNFSDRR